MRNFIQKQELPLIFPLEVLISDFTIRRAVFNLSSDDNLPQKCRACPSTDGTPADAGLRPVPCILKTSDLSWHGLQIRASRSRTRMGGWAVAQSPILVTTITLDRMRKRGYESMLTYYQNLTPYLSEPLYTRTVREFIPMYREWCERLSLSAYYRQGSLLDLWPVVSLFC